MFRSISLASLVLAVRSSARRAFAAVRAFVLRVTGVARRRELQGTIRTLLQAVDDLNAQLSDLDSKVDDLPDEDSINDEIANAIEKALEDQPSEDSIRDEIEKQIGDLDLSQEVSEILEGATISIEGRHSRRR